MISGVTSIIGFGIVTSGVWISGVASGVVTSGATFTSASALISVAGGFSISGIGGRADKSTLNLLGGTLMSTFFGGSTLSFPKITSKTSLLPGTTGIGGRAD